MSIRKIVERIFEFDDQIVELKKKLQEYPRGEQAGLLAELFDEALDEIGEVDQVSLRFARVVELIGDMGSGSSIRQMGTGLDHLNADVRLLCAETLFHLAEDDLEQISPAVDEALQTGGLAAEEMIYLLTELDSSEAVRVLERFVEHDDAQVVALAIEALVEVGDPESVDALKRLKRDERPVIRDEDDDETHLEFNVGQLAQEAIEMLSSEED